MSKARDQAATLARQIREAVRRNNCSGAQKLLAALKGRRAIKKSTLRRLDRVIDRCYYTPSDWAKSLGR